MYGIVAGIGAIVGTYAFINVTGKIDDCNSAWEIIFWQTIVLITTIVGGKYGK